MLYRELIRIRAWDRLHDPSQTGKMTADGILELALAAGIPEEQAQKMATRWAEQRMDAGLTP